jgi:hypothetical protein
VSRAAPTKISFIQYTLQRSDASVIRQPLNRPRDAGSVEAERLESRVVLSDESAGAVTDAVNPESILSNAGVVEAKEVLETASDDRVSLQIEAEAMKAATKVLTKYTHLLLIGFVPCFECIFLLMIGQRQDHSHPFL